MSHFYELTFYLSKARKSTGGWFYLYFLGVLVMFVLGKFGLFWQNL